MKYIYHCLLSATLITVKGSSIILMLTKNITIIVLTYQCKRIAVKENILVLFFVTGACYVGYLLPKLMLIMVA